ncbi:MAG: ferritin-like domain-containing protein [Alphaproteobacteria bacterium]|nr:ferritin-like domain-containing protein [Alphaproteobacteria bacterium]MBU0798034.1 ferritin-like domain-containing protein [Alphaproteobacteria bacterium]MBU0887403.1 ferritin-like domain-containing protein [Alphaproteobacteria bacterium]MBU1811716.1 ferritin-like domain-containing protein [Alphaproteobacteria bacterium]
MATLAEAAVAILATADPIAKARLSRDTAAAWRSGAIAEIGSATPPDRPGRPDRPALLPPAQVKRRKISAAPAGRIALLHALAHIELNAIDLAWDIAARFCQSGLPRGFFEDWVAVGDDESRHFLLLCDRLAALGAGYGDLPAHDGLWEASQSTAHDLMARLALVPLVLEARGLDVTPAMVAKLHAAGDDESAAALQIIHDDEITHVATGRRWFEWEAARQGLEPVAAYHTLVRRYFRGPLKRPFNTASRDKAGFKAAYYEPLASEDLA